MRFPVSRRRANHHTHITDLAGNQAGIFKLSHADGYVIPFLDNVDEAIFHLNIQLNPRMFLQEGSQHPAQRCFRKRPWRTQPQPAAYFPVVLAALEAVMEPEFNFLAIQATTELASPLVIVHGPVAERIGVHSGSGCLGPGFRANATIGRAVRLAAVRLGMAVPGETDMATFGHGGKYAACFAEAACGWEPLHAARGFRAEQSAVTVVAADAPVNVNDYASGSAESVLRMIAGTMAYPGSNNAQGGGEVLLVISPQHLGLLASGGVDRADVQRALFELARVPLTSFSPEIAERVRGRRPGLFEDSSPDAVPVADAPESILLAVAGGPGSHTLFFPTYGETRAVTKPVRE